MRKFFTTTLAVAMAAAIGTTAFAAASPVKNTKEEVTIDVQGKYTEYLSADVVISMDVEWENMEFTYAAAQQGTWNPATHSYDNVKSDAEWIADSKTIKVTNHSNTKVTTAFSFATAGGLAGKTITGNFTNTTLELATAVDTDVSSAPNGTTKFSVSGDAIDSTTELGTITVAFAAAE